MFVNFNNFDNKCIEIVDYLQRKVEKHVLEKRQKQCKITDFVKI